MTREQLIRAFAWVIRKQLTAYEDRLFSYYNQAKDLYQAKDDKHEFHAGADVRRLEMLIMKAGA